MSTAMNIDGLLDTLCPMHLVLEADGNITHAGPTVDKIFAEQELVGQSFFDLFDIKRPRVKPTMDALRASTHKRFHFVMRNVQNTELKGVFLNMPSDETTGMKGGAIVDLSFGISVKEAVRDHNLTNSDFAATDLAVEMLYLIEAQSAAMRESKKLNLRLQGAKAAAEERAFTDGLTGLRNRRSLEPLINRLIDRGEDFMLMHLDLDHFKTVNDTLGHAAGDHVLKVVAEVLNKATRNGDAVIRVGGDEFVLIFTPHVPGPDIKALAMRLIQNLEKPILFEGKTAHISASIGTTRSQDYDFPDIDQMMSDADLALYAAKEAGRGCHMFFSPDMRDGASALQNPAQTGT